MKFKLEKRKKIKYGFWCLPRSISTSVDCKIIDHLSTHLDTKETLFQNILIYVDLYVFSCTADLKGHRLFCYFDLHCD